MTGVQKDLLPLAAWAEAMQVAQGSKQWVLHDYLLQDIPVYVQGVHDAGTCPICIDRIASRGCKGWVTHAGQHIFIGGAGDGGGGSMSKISSIPMNPVPTAQSDANAQKLQQMALTQKKEARVPASVSEQDAQAMIKLYNGQSNPPVPDQTTAIAWMAHEWGDVGTPQNNPKNLALSMVAGDMFGSPQEQQPGMSSSTYSKAQALAADPTFHTFATDVLQKQYDQTQKFLADNNIDTVTLYRGTQFTPPPGGGDTGTAPVTGNSLSSYTTNRQSADNFASGAMDSGSSRVSKTPTPLVWSAQVPASRIIGTSLTGLGVPEEQEVVVIGGDSKMTWTRTKTFGQ